MSFGKNINQQTLQGASYWLKDELPKRLARQVKQLDTLPHGLNLMPSIRKVRDLYLSNFNDVMAYNELMSTRGKDEGLQFTRKLQDIYDRHKSTIINVAKVSILIFIVFMDWLYYNKFHNFSSHCISLMNRCLTT